MQQLTEQEKKRIQRYCTYPKIAATALVMSFVACLLMLPLQMVNDIAFHQKEFLPAGIYTAIALTVIELAIFCYCALAPRFGMQGKQWKELQSRLAVAQTNKDHSAEVAGVLATQAAGRLLKNSDNDLARNLGGAAEVASAVGAVATAADVLAETSSNAEAMANAYGVTIPNVNKQIIALAVLPAIVLLGVYIPQFVQGNNELQARKAAAAEQLAIAQDALEPACERVAADDPYESYHDYGYRIIGYLRDNDLGAQATYVYLSFDADGMLTDVDYVSQIDPEASLADNLARAEQDIATLCAPLNGLDISVATPGLLTPCSLSDEFKQTFLAGSLYKESASRRRTNLSSRTTPLTPRPQKNSTNTPIRKLGSCSLQRRTKGFRSNCRSRTSSISRGLILFREVNDRIWTPEASTFSDAKTAGFNNQNHRKLHLKSVDAPGVHFDSFTSQKSIRPQFREGPM